MPWDRKSSKCLQFDPINSTCTSNATANSSISTAISQQVRYYTPARIPIGSIGVSSIQSHLYGLVLQAFPSQLTVRSLCEIPQPILTFTPIASNAASNNLTNTSETPKTLLSVQYPSKTMNKTHCGSYQTIGKALTHIIPSQIANAVMKNPTLRNHVVEKCTENFVQSGSGVVLKKESFNFKKIWQRRSGQIRLGTSLQRVQRESSTVLLVLGDFRSKQKDQRVFLVFKHCHCRVSTFKAKE